MSRRVVLSAVLTVAVLGGGFSVPVTAQDPGKNPADPKEAKPQEAQKPKDPTAIPAEGLQSWYRILQGEEHIGFAHLFLQPGSGVESGYTVSYEEEGEVRNDETFIPYSVRMRSRLDSGFRALDQEVSMVIAGVVTLDVRMNAMEGDRKYEFVLNDGKPNVITMADAGMSTELHYAFHVLRQKKMLEPGSVIPMKLLACDEQGQFVSALVHLQVLPRNPETDKLVLGDDEIPITPVQVDGLPSASKDLRLRKLYIDSFGRLVKWEYEGDIRVELARNNKDAQGEARRVVIGGRRDPFRKDLPMKVLEDEGGDVRRGGGSRGSGSGVGAGEEKSKLEEAKNLVHEMRGMKRSLREEALKSSYEKFVSFYPSLRERLRDGVMTRDLEALEALRKEAEELYPGAQKAIDEANRLFLEIARLSDEGNCTAMEKKYAELEKFKKRPEILHRPESVELETKLLQPADKLIQKCRVREALKKKKLVLSGTIHEIEQFPTTLRLPLQIVGQGVLLHQDVVLVKRDLVALINDQPFHVGDVIQNEDVKIERIDRFGVEVSYKGELRYVPLRD